MYKQHTEIKTFYEFDQSYRSVEDLGIDFSLFGPPYKYPTPLMNIPRPTLYWPISSTFSAFSSGILQQAFEQCILYLGQ